MHMQSQKHTFKHTHTQSNNMKTWFINLSMKTWFIILIIYNPPKISNELEQVFNENNDDIIGMLQEAVRDVPLTGSGERRSERREIWLTKDVKKLKKIGIYHGDNIGLTTARKAFERYRE